MGFDAYGLFHLESLDTLIIYTSKNIGANNNLLLYEKVSINLFETYFLRNYLIPIHYQKSDYEKYTI